MLQRKVRDKLPAACAHIIRFLGMDIHPRPGAPNASVISFRRVLKHRAGRRIDQVHMIRIGVEPHRFARSGGVSRIEAAADFLAVDAEEYRLALTGTRYSERRPCVRRTVNAAA